MPGVGPSPYPATLLPCRRAYHQASNSANDAAERQILKEKQAKQQAKGGTDGQSASRVELGPMCVYVLALALHDPSFCYTV